MKRIAARLALLAVVAAAALYFATAPRPLDAGSLPAHQPDLANGERLYWAAGCLSCHKPARDNAEADPTLPSGGAPLRTPAGVFYPPNITPDRDTGIGGWSDLAFVNAVMRGLSPAGAHYLPAFPYTSYARMRVEDVLDIKAYVDSLAPVSAAARPPDLPLGLPVEWFVRRSLGLWKLAAFDPAPFAPDPAADQAVNEGAYLVQGPGHCAECHTPRNLIMALDTGRWLAGGPHPEGDGAVPSLRDLVGRGRYKDAGDLALALEFGETFGYDKLSSGGMGQVQSNLARLPGADRQAIAAYLVSLK